MQRAVVPELVGEQQAEVAQAAALLRERSTLVGRRVGVVLTGGNIERARFLQVLNGRTPTAGDADPPSP